MQPNANAILTPIPLYTIFFLQKLKLFWIKLVLQIFFSALIGIKLEEMWFFISQSRLHCRAFWEEMHILGWGGKASVGLGCGRPLFLSLTISSTSPERRVGCSSSSSTLGRKSILASSALCADTLSAICHICIYPPSHTQAHIKPKG